MFISQPFVSQHVVFSHCSEQSFKLGKLIG